MSPSPSDGSEKQLMTNLGCTEKPKATRLFGLMYSLSTTKGTQNVDRETAEGWKFHSFISSKPSKL